jgi:hypothetical protein
MPFQFFRERNCEQGDLGKKLTFCLLEYIQFNVCVLSQILLRMEKNSSLFYSKSIPSDSLRTNIFICKYSENECVLACIKETI